MSLDSVSTNLSTFLSRCKVTFRKFNRILLEILMSRNLVQKNTTKDLVRRYSCSEKLISELIALTKIIPDYCKIYIPTETYSYAPHNSSVKFLKVLLRRGYRFSYYDNEIAATLGLWCRDRILYHGFMSRSYDETYYFMPQFMLMPVYLCCGRSHVLRLAEIYTAGSNTIKKFDSIISSYLKDFYGNVSSYYTVLDRVKSKVLELARELRKSKMVKTVIRVSGRQKSKKLRAEVSSECIDNLKFKIEASSHVLFHLVALPVFVFLVFNLTFYATSVSLSLTKLAEL